MPLIQCLECGASVSNAASACPRCGFPIAGSTPLQGSHVVAAGIGIAGAMLMIWSQSPASQVVGGLMMVIGLVGVLDQRPAHRLGTRESDDGKR